MAEPRYNRREGFSQTRYNRRGGFSLLRQVIPVGEAEASATD